MYFCVIAETNANFVELNIAAPTPWIVSAPRPDIWINAMEQFSCVNCTDEITFTIIFSAGGQNTIDFSSAGGLRNTFDFLERAVLG